MLDPADNDDDKPHGSRPFTVIFSAFLYVTLFGCFYSFLVVAIRLCWMATTMTKESETTIK